MSIPVERRDLGEGWVITCHGPEGGDLTLTDVTIKRENLVCQILGGDTLFFPMFTEDEPNSSETLNTGENYQSPRNGEQSILEHIRDLIANAEQSGCWKMGLGGINQVRSKSLLRQVSLQMCVATNRPICCESIAGISDFLCFELRN